MSKHIMDAEEESHPSFGWARVNRLSSSPPGRSLFDSEIRHQQFVRLEISTATRRRNLNRDWIHGSIDTIIEVDMSMAQWGALVSSFGSSGVPVTLNRVDHEDIPEPAYEPRMKKNLAEIDAAADDTFGEIADAAQAVLDAFEAKAGRKEMGEALRRLANRIDVAKPNLKYVAQSLTEHVEETVTKARYDIEAAVQMAAERGLDSGDIVHALLPGDDRMHYPCRNRDCPTTFDLDAMDLFDDDDGLVRWECPDCGTFGEAPALGITQ